jgi:hypothetical protein
MPGVSDDDGAGDDGAGDDGAGDAGAGAGASVAAVVVEPVVKIRGIRVSYLDFIPPIKILQAFFSARFIRRIFRSGDGLVQD